MKMWLPLFLMLGVVPSVNAQNCPNGIPSANNPSCLPPSVPQSPYYSQPEPEPVPAPARPAGYWEDRWGAIAIGTASPDVATANNEASEAVAVATALEKCRGSEGISCKTMMTFHNQCGALAWPTLGGYAATAAAPTKVAAEQEAMKICAETGKGCKVFFSECAAPVFHRY